MRRHSAAAAPLRCCAPVGPRDRPGDFLRDTPADSGGTNNCGPSPHPSGDDGPSLTHSCEAIKRRESPSRPTGPPRCKTAGPSGVSRLVVRRRSLSPFVRGCGRRLARRHEPKYLVDPASSHMLVSKTKPCTSKNNREYTRESADGSLYQLWFIGDQSVAMDNCGNSRANTCD